MYKNVITVLALFLMIMSNANAQGDKLFYDSIWRITNEKNAEYYRVGTVSSGCFTGKIKDCFITGEQQMTGNYNNGKKEGEFKFYFKNGKLRKQGFFENNERIGVWNYYNSNGTLRQKLQFSSNHEFKLLEYNDSLGNEIEREGNKLVWKNRYVDYYTDGYSRFGKFHIEGAFENNVKSGEWICKDGNGNILYVEKFYKGNFKKRTSRSDQFSYRYPDSPMKVPFKKNEEIYNKLPVENKFYRTENFIYSPNVIIKGFKPQMFIVSEVMPSALFTKDILKSVTNQIKEVVSETHPDYKKLEIKYLIQKDGTISNISMEKIEDQVVSKKIRNIMSENIFWTPGYQRQEPVYISKSLVIELE